MNNYFPRLNEKEIINLLKRKELENIDAIKIVEKFLIKKRGYIFKIPPPKTPVILLMSGGLDTTITAAILMEKYKLEVYPLFLRRARGQCGAKKEESSVNFFSKIYTKRYPKQFHWPMKLNMPMPPREIGLPIIKTSNEILKKWSEQRRGIPVYTSLLVSYGVQYVYFLETTQKIKIRNIFCGVVNYDGNQMAHQTLTALRTTMLDICCQTKDFSWQVVSLAVEKELGFYFSKDTFIKWGQKHNLPIHRTWSCYHDNLLQCGKCGGCEGRKESFFKADIADKTAYEDQPLLRKLSRLLLFYILPEKISFKIINLFPSQKKYFCH